MINEVDEALRSLVRAEVVNGADVDVLFDAPTREWAARRNTPTIDLYLYDIREDLRRRETGMIDIRDEQGIVVERRPGTPVLQARLPHHGLDPAPGGRAPAALGRPGLLHAA